MISAPACAGAWQTFPVFSGRSNPNIAGFPPIINAAGGQNNAKSPRTGDERNALLWLGILLASAVLLILTTVVLARKGKLKLSRGPKAPRSPRKPKG